MRVYMISRIRRYIIAWKKSIFFVHAIEYFVQTKLCTKYRTYCKFAMDTSNICAKYECGPRARAYTLFSFSLLNANFCFRCFVFHMIKLTCSSSIYVIIIIITHQCCFGAVFSLSSARAMRSVCFRYLVNFSPFAQWCNSLLLLINLCIACLYMPNINDIAL